MDYSMRIAIDANMLIAALVRDSKAREIIMSDKFGFVSPDFVLNEIYKYEDEICEKAGLSKIEFELLMALIFQKISVITADYYENYKECQRNNERGCKRCALCRLLSCFEMRWHLDE